MKIENKSSVIVQDINNKTTLKIIPTKKFLDPLLTMFYLFFFNRFSFMSPILVRE